MPRLHTRRRKVVPKCCHDPELIEFADDAWRSPGRIGPRDPANQFPNISVDARSPWPTTLALATPVLAEATFLPLEHGTGSDEVQ